MRVLSLFDGISCARVALERAGFAIDTYYASEVDKYAIQIAQKNYPNTIQLGDVRGITKDMVGEVDLLIGGSPCQDLSIAKKGRKGLDGERSGLFREYVRIIKEVQPKYFILENVNSMPKEAKQIITDTLGVEPIMINASLVSAQSRKRLFRTNIPGVTQPEDRGILLRDILEESVDEVYFMSEEKVIKAAENVKAKTFRTGKRRGPMALVRDLDGKALTITASCFGAESRTSNRVGHYNSGGQGDRIYSTEGKSVSLSALGGGGGAKTGLYDIPPIRKLTPIECERLQGLPDNYTEGLSNTQRYKCLGNAFNVDVVAHIVSFIPTEVT